MSRQTTSSALPETRSEVGALRRGFAVLDVLLEATHPQTSRDVAEAMQLSDSTVHRLLQTLCEAGYAVRDTSRRYRASGKALLPLAIYHPLNMLRRDGYEPLRTLRKEFDLTASLVAFLGMERLILDVSGATGTLAPYYGTHLENPLHVSASGKLLLATMSPADRATVLGPPPYTAVTPASVTDPQVLDAQIASAATLGVATNLDENFTGFAAIAAAVVGGPGQFVGCLILTGPTELFGEAPLRQMSTSLRNQAQLISIGSHSIRAIRALFPRPRT